MDFAALPPEVNSALMYTGAGAGPLLSAATAWDGLAADLQVAATAYRSVVTELTSGTWTGPASAAMVTSINPFVTWLSSTSAHAAKTAGQAKAAMAAYEAAFAMTVPPPVVTANRAQLMMLLATNFLGQNAAVIAATEARYAEMWAQDATAMYGYASASAAAAELEPFPPPPPTTNPAGALGQAAAVQNAAGNSAGSNAQTLPSQLASTLQGAGPAQATPTVMPVQAEPPLGLLDVLGILADETALGIALPLSIIALPLSVISLVMAVEAAHYSELDSREIFDTQDLLYGGQKNILDALSQLGATTEVPTTENLRVPHESVKVAYGEAFPMGALSVPIGWAEAAPEIRHASFSTPLSGAASPAGLGTAFGQMALAGMGGSALAGAVNRNREGSGTPAAAQSRPTQAAGSPPPAAPSPGRPLAVPLAELAAGIRELGELHDAGYLTAEEFAEQKRRLLAR